MRLVLRNFFYLLLGIVTVLAFSGNAQAASKQVVDGPCGSLFGAHVCTSYQMQVGKITQFSVTVPVAMIKDAPTNAPMVMPPRPDLDIPLAPEVEKQTGFTYVSIYWEPHGHPPAVYMVPHFDFHFYFAPKQTVEKIDCKNPVKPQTVPTGYVLPPAEKVPGLGVIVGACIPDMGMHAGPKADFNPKSPWKGSLEVGYYDGKAIFFEPMITNALLLEKHSFAFPIPQGIEPATHVRYPKTFRAVYLPKSNAYDFTFFY